jgi:uncharacterized protein YegP (UPF0339 family)
MKFEIVKSRAKKLYTPGATKGKLQYRVRVRGRNGRILLSSETYNARIAARRMIAHVSAQALWTRVVDIDETGDKPKKKGKR